MKKSADRIKSGTVWEATDVDNAVNYLYDLLWPLMLKVDPIIEITKTQSGEEEVEEVDGTIHNLTSSLEPNSVKVPIGEGCFYIKELPPDE